MPPPVRAGCSQATKRAARAPISGSQTARQRILNLEVPVRQVAREGGLLPEELLGDLVMVPFKLLEGLAHLLVSDIERLR